MTYGERFIGSHNKMYCQRCQKMENAGKLHIEKIDTDPPVRIYVCDGPPLGAVTDDSDTRS